MTAVIDNILRTRHVRLVEFEEGRSVEDGEERCPLLEKDADQLIGLESSRCFPDDGTREGVVMCDVGASR
jgi:hypothetical protein